MEPVRGTAFVDFHARAATLVANPITAATDSPKRGHAKRSLKYRHDSVSCNWLARDSITTPAQAPSSPGRLRRPARSEERRVGNACDSTCRSRWSASHSKNNNTDTDHNTHQQTDYNI